jgi:hypothetical protein
MASLTRRGSASLKRHNMSRAHLKATPAQLASTGSDAPR